jgi:hypothetical protein
MVSVVTCVRKNYLERDITFEKEHNKRENKIP